MKQEWNFIRRLNQCHVVIMIGLFLSQSLLLQFYNQIMQKQHISHVLIIALWISSIGLLLCIYIYVFQKTHAQYLNVYEFIILPIFGCLTVNTLKASSPKYIILTSLFLFCIGVATSILNLAMFYSRKIINKDQNIIRISINYRLFRVIRILFSTFLFVFNHQISFAWVSIVFSVFSIIICFSAVTKFSFQNSYQQYLTIAMTFASVISAIQGICYAYELSQYDWLGQTFAIGVILFQPSFMVRCLQLKYQYFMDKNIEMRNEEEMVGVFVIMKQIIFNQNVNFKYSNNLKNKVFIAYQKMLYKSKKLFSNIGYYNHNLQSIAGSNNGSSSVGSIFNFSVIQNILQECQVFYNLVNVRILQSDDFYIYEFYLTIMLKNKIKNFNKSISQFYKKKVNKQNFLQTLRGQILYTNILKFKGFNQESYNQHLTIRFYRNIDKLIKKIKAVCKNQTQLASILQSASKVSLSDYSDKLSVRNQTKKQINSLIGQMLNVDFCKFSSFFLHLTLLYKLVFQKQQKIIRDKLYQHFVIPLATNQRQNILLVQFQKKSIIVCSAVLDGQIINQNQNFSKIYEPASFKNNVESKKLYISDLLLNSTQKKNHQVLFQKSSKYQSQQKQNKTHADYVCYIFKKVRNSFDQQATFIKIIQKVKIQTRIYYCLNQVFNYICTIQKVFQTTERVKVLAEEVSNLEQKGFNLRVIRTQTLEQLDNSFKCCEIIISQNLDFEQMNVERQQLQVNCSQVVDLDKDQTFQDQKMQKVERSFEREGMSIYINQANLLILMSFIIILFGGLVIWCQLFKSSNLASMNEYINMNQQIIKNTYLTSKVVGLQLILYHYFLQNSQDNFCLEYTQVYNMTEYLRNNLISYADTKFTSMEQMHIKVSFVQQPIINLFSKTNYNLFQVTLPGNIQMDYFKFVAFVKSIMFDNAQPFQQPQEDFELYFKDAVKKMINSGPFNKTKDFYNSIQQAFTSASSDLKDQFTGFYYISFALSIIFFAAFMFVVIKMIKNECKHLNLLRCFDRQFCQKRQSQSKFLCDQIQKITNSQYKNISVNRSLNLKITKWDGIQTYSIQQFQKLSLPQQKINAIQNNVEREELTQSQKVSLINQQEKKQLKKSNLNNITVNICIIKSLLSLKFALMAIFMIFFGIIGLHLYDNSILLKQIQNNFMYNSVIKDINNVQQSMLDIATSQWLMQINDPFYREDQSNLDIFNQAVQYINTSTYIQKIRTNFDNQSAYQILYNSYCANTNINLQQCQSFNEGSLKQGFSFIAQMINNDANKILPIKDSYPLLFKKQICTKLVMFLNYTLDQFGFSLTNSYTQVHAQTDQTQQIFISVEVVLYIMLIFSVGILGVQLYLSAKKTRSQILSIDSKSNLYAKYEQFRPFLNELYYRRQ